MRVLWIVLGVLLTGCATYQPKPLDPIQVADRFERRSLDDAALRDYLAQQLGHPPATWPLAVWNRQMLTLAAGFYSPALAAARARQQAAQAGVASADVHPNPLLQFPFEYELNHHDGGRPVTTGPVLDWPIETAGKRQARVDQAAALAEAARLNALNDAWTIRSQVRAALLAVYAATSRAGVLADKAALQQRSVELLEHRLAAGAIATPELRQARLLLSQAQSALAAEQVALRDARARLATAIGVPVAALDAVRFDFAEFEHPVVVPARQPARRALILHRADLRSALADYEASQAALQLEVARQYPDIHLGIGYTYDVGASKIDFGLAGLTLPVFDTNRGQIAQAEARRAEQAAHVEALQSSILNDLDNALARERAGVVAVERAAGQLATASHQRASQQADLAAGLTGRLELVQARIDYQAVALDYLNAVVALQEASGQLEDAMQQPLPAGTASFFSTPPGATP